MSDNQRISLRKRVSLIRELKTKITGISIDFLANRSKKDFIGRINNLQLDGNHIYILTTLISISFDRKEEERKHVSDLIIYLIMQGFTSKDQLSEGIKILLGQIQDLVLDIPDVVQYLEYFVNRFIDCKVLDFKDSKNFLDLLSIYSGSNQQKTVKKIVKKVFENYFVTEQLGECCSEILEISDKKIHPLIVKYCISLSLDRGSHERELLSRFLSEIVDDSPDSKFMTRKSLEDGFILLLNCIEDLYEDVPYVYQYLSFFIARAIHDECLAPSFITRNKKNNDDSVTVLENAENLLKMENSTDEMSKIWDCNVDDLLQIKTIVRKNAEAFFDSAGDADAFRRFLRELDHPHFHYRAVYALFSVLLDRGEHWAKQVADLISSLFHTGISTKEQLEKGFEKINRLLPELKLDNKNSEEVYENLKSQTSF